MGPFDHKDFYFLLHFLLYYLVCISFSWFVSVFFLHFFPASEAEVQFWDLERAGHIFYFKEIHFKEVTIDGRALCLWEENIFLIKEIYFYHFLFGTFFF